MITTYKTKNYYHDVLIIGSGGSGLAAAILAKEKDFDVAVISKIHPLQSHTIAAQGGINAALGNVTKDDYKWHMYDTIKASAWLADQDSVEYMCKTAPNVISMLDRLGVEFDHNSNGVIDQKIYGGQSTDFGKGEMAYRACYSKDKTGHTIMNKLYAEAISKGIIFYNYNFAIDLMVEDNQSMGCVTWDVENGIINIIKAGQTILATGGYSQIYSTATSAAICTGDGNGLAARAGVPLQDMEFIQFHPTAINKVGILITEASRSAGGILRNANNERFMQKYAPKFMELAARDVVARAIATEINEGRGAGIDKDHVFLDLTHMSSDEIKNTLPTVYENCQEFGKIDPSENYIPISPASHYTMGGVPTNSDCQVVICEGEDKVIKGLYAIGETASISVHGAGRLGCNSLLDLIVFAEKATSNLVKSDISSLPFSAEPILKKFANIFTGNDYSVLQLTAELKRVMNKYVGVFRRKEELLLALNKVMDIKKRFNNSSPVDKSLVWNMELQHYLELENMIVSAICTIKAALWRKESRGSHWRTDYPDQNDKEFLIHSICNGIDEEKVIGRTVRKIEDNVGFFQPEKRNY
jgi:succinate dehydrogenase/fumarate reductase flavoprotein subunit